MPRPLEPMPALPAQDKGPVRSSWISRFWHGRSHDLGQMDLRQLAGVFFLYPAIVVYLNLALASAVIALMVAPSWVPLAAGTALGVLIWPLAWYGIHRFILHGKFLFRSKWTAKIWKRIHFDHHQDPQDLRVLFGALDNTLPTIVLMSVPLGWLLGGLAGAAAALSAALIVTVFNEFVHCVQHLNITPPWAFLRNMKRLHVAHHYHSEQGNFGIADFVWDRVFGTYYSNSKERAKSSTVYNLGYTQDEAERYPWVQEFSNGRRLDDGPRRINQASVSQKPDRADHQQHAA